MGTRSKPLRTLKKRAEFQRIRGGARFSTRGFLIEAKVRSVSEPEFAGPRFGLTITKKIGNAVERNRIRRRLKSILRGSAATHARPGFDYVLVARRPALDCVFSDLEADVVAALQRVASPKAAKHR